MSYLGNTNTWPSIRTSRDLAGVDELSRPHVKYFLYYPLILAFAAILLWIFPTDMMTAVSSAIGTVISCLMLWEYLFTNSSIRLSSVSVMGLGVAYAGGTLNSWLTISRGEYSLAFVIGQTVPELANGVAAALMGCAILLCVGELFERPVLTTAQRITVTSGIKRIVELLFVILIAAFATGKFQQGGAVGLNTSRAGFTAIFLEFILPPAAVLAVIVMLAEKRKIAKYAYGCIVLCLFAIEMTQGRRHVVYPALVAVGLARYAGYRWSQISLRRILLIAGACVFLFFGVLTYQALRLAGGRIQSHAISEQAPVVENWVRQGRFWKIAISSSSKNVKLRSLEVHFLSDLLYRETQKSPAYGLDLARELEATIPSIIDKNKHTVAEETTASQTFGIYYPDQPNSVLTAGALDFGLYGVMIYPIVIILLFSLVLREISKHFYYEVFVFALAAFVQVAMAAENEISAYFVTVRNIIIFSILFYLIARMALIRWKLRRDIEVS